MDRHAGGLVENNEVAVLIDNRKRQIDGNEIFVWFDVRNGCTQDLTCVQFLVGTNGNAVQQQSVLLIFGLNEQMPREALRTQKPVCGAPVKFRRDLILYFESCLPVYHI